MSLQSGHTFRIFANQPGLVHGCFHRHGGSSPAPYDSLNISFGVGDSPDNVRNNRALVKESLGCDALISTRQIHGAEVAVIRAKHEDLELEGYDALITDQPGLALLIQQADCQAVLLYDPQKQVVANIHCGWRGSVANIIAATLERLIATFHCDPDSIKAAISPALGPCCAEFIHYKKELPVNFHAFKDQANHFDFLAISTMQLREVGIRPDHIEVAGICTQCNPEWFSFRRQPQTGRFCTAIGLMP